MEFRIIDSIGFIMLKKWNLNAFQNCQWTIHPEEPDPLDARSYAGRIKLPYSGTERIKKFDVEYDDDDDEDSDRR
jgi:hypothetical protein